MRVLQMIDTLFTGGAERLQITFAEGVQSKDVDLTVVSLRAIDSHYPDLLKSLGATVHILPAPKLLHPQRMWALWKLFRSGKYDIIHSHLGYANILAGFIGRLAGVPVVSSLHNTSVYEAGQHRLQVVLETLALRFAASRVIAVGYAVADAHRARLRGKHIEVIPNAVSLLPPLTEEERIAVRTAIMGDPTRSLLISVGRLWPQKGYFDLLDAFTEIRKTYPRAALAIVGSGDLYDELSTRINTLGLEADVFLLGKRTDVPKLLAASDLYVSASHWEGLPIAVLEAMSAGLPVVATTVGDVPRAVVEGTGLVVPPQAPQALANAVCSLLGSPETLRASGVAARTHVTAVYGVENWVNRLLSLYHDVLQ